MRVLIAEDDATSGMILESIIKKWSYTPVVVRDGEKAWEIMRSQNAPRLVILDWQMPGMSGINVCRKIRSLKTSDPPYIIVLTTRGEKKDIVTALESGANDFISKPYDPDELKARLNVGKRMLQLQSALLDALSALEHEAMHDPLTGIYNRRAIIMMLEKEMARARREKTNLYIGMCDLDHFKKINDTHGHKAGDDAIVDFTKCAGKVMRISDHIGRYGGEEFLLIIPGSSGQGPGEVFDRICRSVRKNTTQADGRKINFTVSIGVASFSGNNNVDHILKSADKALYHAKNSGRDQVAFFDDL